MFDTVGFPMGKRSGRTSLIRNERGHRPALGVAGDGLDEEVEGVAALQTERCDGGQDPSGEGRSLGGVVALAESANDDARADQPLAEVVRHRDAHVGQEAP